MPHQLQLSFGPAAVPGAITPTGQLLPAVSRFVQRVGSYESQHLRDLSRTCPGVLLVLYEVARVADTATVAPVIRIVHQGARLHSVLTSTSDLWWQHFARYSTRPRAETEALQISLWRRAPARMLPRAVHLLPLPGMTISDIPQGHLTRAAWYHRMSRLTTVWRTAPKRLVGFVSRHGGALGAMLDGERKLDELIDYARRSGEAIPCRRSNLQRVLVRVEHWHQRLWEESGAKDDDFPEPPFREHTDGPLTIKALTSASELVEEGRRMRHCVASYRDLVASGDLFVYRATYADRPLTVAIKPVNQCWGVAEIRGTRNSSAGPAANRAIRDFIASVRG